MAKTKKALHDELRKRYLDALAQFFEERGEEVLITGTNEFAIPCVDSEQNDEFVIVSIKVPTGDREGCAYDGYTTAEMFKEKQAEKQAKAEQAKIAKEKKIAKDKADREARAKAKAEHQAKVGQ